MGYAEAYRTAYKSAFRSAFILPDVSVNLFGTGEGGSSIVALGNGDDITGFKYQINDVDATDPASENLVLHSNDLSNGVWSYSRGTNGALTKTQDGTIKAPNGVDNVAYWDGRDNIFFQSVPIVASTDYTLSFLAYANAMQPAIIRLPDGSNKRMMFKQGWNRYTYTANSGGNTSLSVRFDTRTASFGASSLFPSDGFRYAIADIQLEQGTQATSYITTTTTTASRVGGQLASGQSFTVPSGNSGDKISVISLDTGSKRSKTFDNKRFAIFIGQSNFILGAGHDPFRDYVSHYVKVIGRRVDDTSGEVTNGLIVPYNNPSHWDAGISSTTGDISTMDRGDISLAGFLCDDIANYLGGVEIIAECGNEPGSQFSSTWSTTGVNYLSTKARLDAFIATYPDAECVGIFYSGMETDIVSGTPYLTHRSVVINTVDTLRGLYGNCPFIAIGVQDDWTVTGALREEYMAGFRELNTTGWSGFVSAGFVDTDFAFNGGINYTSNDDEGHVPTDTTHFSSEAHELLSQQIFTKWKQIINLQIGAGGFPFLLG